MSCKYSLIFKAIVAFLTNWIGNTEYSVLNYDRTYTVRLAFHFNLLHATNLSSVFRYCKLFVEGYKHICWCKCLITQTTYQLPSLVQFTFVLFTGAFVDYIQIFHISLVFIFIHYVILVCFWSTILVLWPTSFIMNW